MVEVVCWFGGNYVVEIRGFNFMLIGVFMLLMIILRWISYVCYLRFVSGMVWRVEVVKLEKVRRRVDVFNFEKKLVLF